MTTDPFAEAARAEAERRHPAPEIETGAQLGYTQTQIREVVRRTFTGAAEWARNYLAAQEPDMAEQEARWVVEHKHQFHGSQCLCGFESHRARSRTEHIMTHYFDELSAARSARRDEETTR